MSPIKYINQPERIFRTMRDSYHGFPWRGDSGMGITSSSACFNPAFKVYSLPLSDASRPECNKFESFDDYIYDFKQNFKIGDIVNGIQIDRSNDKNMSVYGKLADFKIDYENKRIRVYVRDDKSLEVIEVFPETLFNNNGLYESLKKEAEDKYNMIFG